MVPAQREVGLQLLAVVVVQVQASHLVGVQSATVPPAGVLVLVVHVAHHHQAHLVGEAAGHAARGVAVLGTAGQVEVGHVAAVHTFLNSKVEHGLLIAVLNAGDAGLVALLVVELHVLDDVHGQVLQRRLDVAEHELLAVEQNLLHLLAVHGDVAVLVDLGARHALDQLLDGRALGRSVGFGVEHQRVLAHNDLGCTPRHHGLLQHHGLGRHHEVTEVVVAVVAQRHLALNRLKAHRRNLQPINSVRRGLDSEVTAQVGHRTTHKRTVLRSE